MNKKPAILFAIAVLFFLPFIAGAVNFPGINPSFPDLQYPGVSDPNVPNVVDAVINIIWQIFLGFSILLFIIAGFVFLAGRGEPAKMAIARQMVIYGVIGIIVGILAFSIGGIINYVLFDPFAPGACRGEGVACEQDGQCCSGTCVSGLQGQTINICSAPEQ